MLRSAFRVSITLVVTLVLALGAFPGVALAASNQPVAAAGINPVASTPTGIGYCYPSGYNKQGWRCGWRLAMYPYNMGSYNNYYNPYYYGYGYGYGYPNYGTGGQPISDYGGQPRYGNYYYGGYYYGNCYYYYWSNGQYYYYYAPCH